MLRTLAFGFFARSLVLAASLFEKNSPMCTATTYTVTGEYYVWNPGPYTPLPPNPSRFAYARGFHGMPWPKPVNSAALSNKDDGWRQSVTSIPSSLVTSSMVNVSPISTITLIVSPIPLEPRDDLDSARSITTIPVTIKTVTVIVASVSRPSYGEWLQTEESSFGPTIFPRMIHATDWASASVASGTQRLPTTTGSKDQVSPQPSLNPATVSADPLVASRELKQRDSHASTSSLQPITMISAATAQPCISTTSHIRGSGSCKCDYVTTYCAKIVPYVGETTYVVPLHDLTSKNSTAAFQDCLLRCDNEGDCISVSYRLSTKQCTLYADSVYAAAIIADRDYITADLTAAACNGACDTLSF